jgi:hypothetical protein
MRTAYIPVALGGLFALVLPARASALPDATVTQMRAEGRDYRGGDVVPLEITVTNRGDGALPPVPVVLTVDDEPYAEWRLPAAVSPGESTVWSVSWRAARGSHVILATVDPLNDVAELSETNNSGFISLGVEEQPEASPWPAALVGFASFLFGAGLALVIQRVRRGRPSRRRAPPARRRGEGASANRR